MHKIFSVLIALFIGLVAFAQGVKIGVYNNQHLHRVAFSPVAGSYRLHVDGKDKHTIGNGEILYLKREGEKVTVSMNGKWLASGSTIALIGNDLDAQCRVKPIIPNLEEHVYADVITAKSRAGKLRIINEVEYPDYVAGVVEAESGKGRDIEFYKTQSILARTYAIANRGKHAGQGFHLCDQVHCQVYHGVARHDAIIPLAVEATKNLIAVDHEIEPIDALFHSNCGGQTISAADVWHKALPYCKTVKDPYCLAMPHSNWEKTVSKSSWLDYLKRNEQPSRDSLAQSLDHYPGQKITRLYNQDSSLLLKDIRKDWGLRSTFFAISAVGDSILFSGAGYGHGVGLCQEGAIRMGELDFKYDEILHFYYHNIHIIDLRQLEFYREEVE